MPSQSFQQETPEPIEVKVGDETHTIYRGSRPPLTLEQQIAEQQHQLDALTSVLIANGLTTIDEIARMEDELFQLRVMSRF